MHYTFVVNSLEDVETIKETARKYNIDCPQIIQYPFQRKLIEEAKQVPGWEQVPVPVMNVLMEYGKNFIVSFI